MRIYHTYPQILKTLENKVNAPADPQCVSWRLTEHRALREAAHIPIQQRCADLKNKYQPESDDSQTAREDCDAYTYAYGADRALDGHLQFSRVLCRYPGR